MTARKRTVLAIELVWAALMLSLPSTASAQGVTKATLEGTFVLDRSKPSNPCVVISPPVLRGTLKLIVDIDKGQVSGDFRGGGSGQVGLRAQCGQDELDREFKADATFAGTIEGTVNRTSGAIDARVTVNTFSGKLYQVELGGHRCLYQGNWLTECPKREAAVPQTATLKGNVKSDGTASGELIWDTNYCLKLSKNVDGNCAADEKITRGTWTAKGPVIKLAIVNRAPEILALSQSPENPDTDDTVTLTVTARDPDGDKLTYAWTVDGERRGADAPSFPLTKLSATTYHVRVTVTDGKGGEASQPIDVVIKEAESFGDKDGDGVADKNDACPEEWGNIDKGCPAFAVTLSCPEQVTAGTQATCTAAVVGRRTGESILYTWFVGGTPKGSGEQATCSWTMELGSTTVTVEATGDGRWERAWRDVEEVSQAKLTVSIGMAPNPAVIDKPVVFSASVLGNRPNEEIHYAWSLDGQTKCGDTLTCPIGALAAEQYTMRVLVRGQGQGREAEGIFNFSVSAPRPLAPDTMGFKIAGINCTDGVSSDEKLSCRAFFEYEGNKPVPLEVAWFVDGATMASGTATGSSAWSLDQPAPGTHTVQVRALDPTSRAAAASTTTVTIRPGANAQIPPADQAAAAAGTAAITAVWLWGEWWAKRRAIRGASEPARAQSEAVQTQDELTRSRQDAESREREQPSSDEIRAEAARKKEASEKAKDIGRRHAEQAELDRAAREREAADLRAKRNELEHELKARKAELERAERMFNKAKAKMDVEIWSRMSDGIIDTADLVLGVARDLAGAASAGSTKAAEKGVSTLGGRIVKEAVKGFAEEGIKGTVKDLFRDRWERQAGQVSGRVDTVGSHIEEAIGFPTSGASKAALAKALEEGTIARTGATADSLAAKSDSMLLSHGETVTSGIRDYEVRTARIAELSLEKRGRLEDLLRAQTQYHQAKMSLNEHLELMKRTGRAH